MAIAETRKVAVRVSTLIAKCSDSHAEIAAKLGVDKSLVTRWRSGTRKTSAEQLAKLEELYGSPATPPPPSLPNDDDDGDEDGDDNGRNDRVDEYADEANPARLRRYIREGMRELQNEAGLSGVKRAEALKKLADAQVALDRSTGENAVTMRRIVAHPEFIRVVGLIIEAIAPFPGALAAVKVVLERSR